MAEEPGTALSASRVTWLRVFGALVAVVVMQACTRESPALDDEAMARARKNKLVGESGPNPLSDQERGARQRLADEWFPTTARDYFDGMDQVSVVHPEKDGQAVRVFQLLDHAAPTTSVVRPQLTPDEIRGRNAWMMWTGGNEGFWDWLGRQFGFLDFLKLVESGRRDTRFSEAGLINEPKMSRTGGPSDYEFGLWLDQPADERIREWRRNYVKNYFSSTPGATRDYASEDVPNPEVYGLSSGVVGLRLFLNPKFDAEAQRKWQKAREHGNPLDNPTLERPYRVGMSCAFCHASFHPLKPPLQQTSPEWENLSGTIGAQYLRIRAVFGNLLPKDNFVYHLLDSQPPGTIDTSLIASDNINNPNTMNAVFKLTERAVVSLRTPKERQHDPSAAMPSIWRHPEAHPPQGAPDVVPDAVRDLIGRAGLTAELHGSNGDPRRVPRILVDGADSIGAWGALSRVYLNIGTNWEQWNQLHLPVVGFQPQRPFTIGHLEKHSLYWYATQRRVPYIRDYFLKVTPSMPLADAATAGAPASPPQNVDPPAPSPRPSRIDVHKLKLGREVFAKNCITCHSSIQPESRWEAMATEAAGGELWDHDPGRWLSDPQYLDWALKQVETPEFWRDNYLSTDYRIPVNLVGTNACRALATNAIAGNMWQDFASEDYHALPPVGAIRFFNPFAGANGAEEVFFPSHRKLEGVAKGGGGPGFYRVPTLASVWATAPFLHNNSLGLFNNDPSVDGRLKAFDDAIRKLLWPERRLWGTSYNDATTARLAADHGLIWRTTQETYLHLRGAYLPGILAAQAPVIRRLEHALPWVKDLPRPLWPVPSAVLLLTAFIVLILSKRFWIRALGYASVAAALAVGAIVYSLNGGLGDLRLGPIPAGTPVNLLANMNHEAPPSELKRTIRTLRTSLTEIESGKLNSNQAWQLLRQRVAPELVAASRCPDFVMDRGHYFEWFKRMSDAEKEALIELLKTF